MPPVGIAYAADQNGLRVAQRPLRRSAANRTLKSQKAKARRSAEAFFVEPLLQIGPATCSLFLREVRCWPGGGPKVAQMATAIAKAVRIVVLTREPCAQFIMGAARHSPRKDKTQWRAAIQDRNLWKTARPARRHRSQPQ